MFEYISDKLYNEPLASYCSFKVGGKAKIMLFVENNKLPQVLAECNELGLPYFVLGCGCNVLFSDKDFDGVIIKLKDKKISKNGNTIIADCGASLQSVIKFAMENSLTGLEWASGIPSSVGGAISGNAGAFGACFSDIVKSCTVLQRNCSNQKEIEKNNKESNIVQYSIVQYENIQCGFSYRNSIFSHSDSVVLNVELQLQEGTKDEISDKLSFFKSKRKNPKGHSAGSVFKNGQNFSAGALIDQAGLKGLRVRGCHVSLEHANFIINDNDAKAQDIYDLIQIIKNTVLEKFQVHLQEEIKLIGF